MAFVRLLCQAYHLKQLKRQLIEEKQDALLKCQEQSTTYRFRHFFINLHMKLKRAFGRCCSFPQNSRLHKLCFNLRRDGTCENYFLKSLIGFTAGFMLTYIFFMFFVVQLNFKIATATAFCASVGSVLTIGLAFSKQVRCVVLLTLPQFFSKKGRQALLAYAFILTLTGPAKNIVNNLSILSESLACGQEQLKSAVRQIIDVVKKPFYAIKDAIKKVVKTVKEVVKKIKEILLKIKRVIMAIVKVIKTAFEFLGKILNMCNKEFGTPFERCSRVFEDAILDCNAKLGPLFNWLCSVTYVVKAVCYIVKVLDFVCVVVDFISNSVIGVVIRKVKIFIRHIKTMFYVRIKFSHSFHFESNSSKTLSQVSSDIVAEIKDRANLLIKFYEFVSSAATIFFVFIIFKVIYYRYQFLSNDRFDNIFLSKDFFQLDMQRAKFGKETILPLNRKEENKYIRMGSKKLVESEKKELSKSVVNLINSCTKIGIQMAADYILFWIMDVISYYAKFQSKVKAPNMPMVFVAGEGFLAKLLRSVVKAFQPLGVELEIDTIPCLPHPIPPDYDRYFQIGTLLIICWVLTVFEPYGLRFRNKIMCYYHPLRAKERTIWLYNNIMRTRTSFLKFARRQLKRKVLGQDGIAKITCADYLRANFRCCRFCLGEPHQSFCLMCGDIFRENDTEKPIRCATPGCPGLYCQQCFSDLANLCTVCLAPIEYGDLSDISEERDSSEDEPPKEQQEQDDSDYLTEAEDNFSFEYQNDRKSILDNAPINDLFYKDVEKQHIPDYATMSSFHDHNKKKLIVLKPPNNESFDSDLTEVEFELDSLLEPQASSTPTQPIKKQSSITSTTPSILQVQSIVYESISETSSGSKSSELSSSVFENLFSTKKVAKSARQTYKKRQTESKCNECDALLKQAKRVKNYYKSTSVLEYPSLQLRSSNQISSKKESRQTELIELDVLNREESSDDASSSDELLRDSKRSN